MVKEFIYSNHFKKGYKKLSHEDQQRVKKALLMLAVEQSHPSLRVKKILGTDIIWEASVSMSIRITFEIDEETLVLRKVGQHDILKKP